MHDVIDSAYYNGVRTACDTTRQQDLCTKLCLVFMSRIDFYPFYKKATAVFVVNKGVSVGMREWKKFFGLAQMSDPSLCSPTSIPHALYALLKTPPVLLVCYPIEVYCLQTISTICKLQFL